MGLKVIGAGFGRTDTLSLKTALEQMGFTAFPFEDAGTLINHSNADLHMFASDYPHIEGGRDPLGSFDGSLTTVPTRIKNSSLKTLGEFLGCEDT